MHLAGGYFDEKVDMYLDSHSHSIPDPIWDLYKFALEQTKGKVDCVFIERDQNFPEEAEWGVVYLYRARMLAPIASDHRPLVVEFHVQTG